MYACKNTHLRWVLGGNGNGKDPMDTGSSISILIAQLSSNALLADYIQWIWPWCCSKRSTRCRRGKSSSSSSSDGWVTPSHHPLGSPADETSGCLLCRNSKHVSLRLPSAALLLILAVFVLKFYLVFPLAMVCWDIMSRGTAEKGSLSFFVTLSMRSAKLFRPLLLEF